jgi:LmbE family N-acetylglucosaminyl deacetylase
MPNVQRRSSRRSRRTRTFMILFAAVALAAVIYLGASWRQAPIPGDPAMLRNSGEELVGAPRRVLVIAAHPDDVEWYVGGTLLRMTAAGSHVTLLVATDGERGRGRDQYTDLAAVRREEQAEAARRLGCADVVSLGLPDMRLRSSGDLLPLVREHWERLAPEVVFSFDARLPQFPYVHPDHQAVGHAAAAVFDSLAEPRPALYLFHSRRPDSVIDITPVMDGKVWALAAHRSQGFRGGAPSIMAGRASTTGNVIGTDFAEAFRRR